MAAPGIPRPLFLLCACLGAGERGESLDAGAALALAGRALDLFDLARLAGRHLVTPMLGPCLAGLGPAGRVPEDFRLYLELVHAENGRRNGWLRQQLAGIAAALNAIGLEPVLLKGSIRLVDGLYPGPGWRFMRDLDPLVPRERLAEAAACLTSLGYGFAARPPHRSGRHRHPPPLRRESEAARVEIHADLLRDRQELCPAPGVLAGSGLVLLDGARVRVPAVLDQLAHLIGHDRLDPCLGGIGMFLARSLFETALLCRGDPAAVQGLLDRAEGAGLGGPVRTHLALTARLFPGYIRPDPAFGPAVALRRHLLLAAERWDAGGGGRRLAWFARLRLGWLLADRAERRHQAANLLSGGYLRRGLGHLHRL